MRVEPTDDDLRLSWDRRRRSDWPATFEDAMKDPILSRLVRMHACHEAIVRVINRSPALAPAPPHVRPLRVPTHPAEFDRKRAAAGDRDDD